MGLSVPFCTPFYSLCIKRRSGQNFWGPHAHKTESVSGILLAKKALCLMYCNKNNLSAELSITHKVRPVQRVKLIMDIMAVFHIKTWIVRRYSYIYNIHHSAWAA